MGSHGQETQQGATVVTAPPPELAERLRAIVDAEVQRAHAELVAEVGRLTHENRQLRERLTQAVADLNTLRGVQG